MINDIPRLPLICPVSALAPPPGLFDEIVAPGWLMKGWVGTNVPAPGFVSRKGYQGKMVARHARVRSQQRLCLLALFAGLPALASCAGSLASPLAQDSSSPKSEHNRSIRSDANSDNDGPPANFRSLYGFQGGTDGGYPAADLLNVNGVFYGTTSGFQTCGTVFTITTAGIETVVHDFEGYDGCASLASLIDVGGNLYGTTSQGGTGCDGGCGTVFEISASGGFSVIYNFKGGQDGQHPVAGLTYLDGILYGTTTNGGKYSEGTIFALQPSGGETVLHSFGGSDDGIEPSAALTAVNGELYGTTAEGGKGKRARGTVFMLTTSGSERVLHTFSKKGDCGGPLASLISVGSTLYGTTEEGGANNEGCVYSVTLSGRKKATESVLYSFLPNGSGDGNEPTSDLLYLNGVLYGTTLYGGNGGGTVFQVTTSGLETVLYGFSSANSPIAGVTDSDGVLYGTTFFGGTKDLGTVFALTPAYSPAQVGR